MNIPIARFRSLLILSFTLIIMSASHRPLHAEWVRTNGPYGAAISCFARSGATLFAGTYGGGIFSSSDSGRTWKGGIVNGMDPDVTAIVVSGSNLYAATWGGVSCSRDNGTTWTPMNTGLADAWVNTLAVSGTAMFAGTRSGVFKSADGGATWSPASNGLKSQTVNSLAVSGTDLFAATGTGAANDTGGVWISRDGGANWSPVDVGALTPYSSLVAVFDSTVFAVSGYYLYRSADHGATWESIVTGGRVLRSFVRDGSDLFVATSDGVLISHDNGRSWPPSDIGVPVAGFNTLSMMGSTVIAGTSVGVFRSADKGATWTESSTGLSNISTNALAASGSTLVASTDRGIFISTDRGGRWTNVRTGSITCLAASAARLFAGSMNGVFTSTDNGAHWSTTSNAVINSTVTSLAFIGSDLFAGTINGVYSSSNNGGSWSNASYGLRYNFIQKLAVSGTTLYAGTANGASGGGLYSTTDKGWSWKQVKADTVKANMTLLAANGNDLFISTTNGIFRLSLQDSSFTRVSPSIPLFTSYCASGTDLFFGGLDILHTTDQGRTWTSTAFPVINVNGLAVLGGDLYAGTSDSGIWRRALSEMVTDVKHVSAAVPERFALEQNYPNPFNPSTTFSFRLAERCQAALTVFNILGAEVATVLSREMPAGAYSVAWNASGLPSGVYFYRLKAGNFAETRKFILNK